MVFTSRAITFRTLSEIRREEGLPTVDDLRRRYRRSLFTAEEAAAAFRAAEAAAALAETAVIAEAEATTSAEAEELEIKCENLNPCASRAGNNLGKLKGKSIPKDVGESSSETENVSPAGASSGTKVEVKGSSVLNRPRGEPIESIVEYVNVAATDTASVTVAEVEGGSVRKCPGKDLDISTSKDD
uniref:uncharacterized protein LOC122596572 isoform X1 n=1 Tax=Erigeron canadensis TaxID=72917 RepID=UPI001CB8B4BA|nr:uncharacterized protein LOC122596572 isoform X1 [Erigeron canadensis]